VTRPRQTVLLISGLHPAGIDQPRPTHLARTLAESNVLVVTPEFAELSRFDITPRVTDRIEAAAVWLALESDFVPDGRIGLIGVSFSAGRGLSPPGLRDRLRKCFHSAATTLQTRRGPPERRLTPGAPHDDGVAIAVLNLGYVPTRPVDEKPNSE